jgi:hypothetical protein
MLSVFKRFIRLMISTMRDVNKVLVRKPEGHTPLVTPEWAVRIWMDSPGSGYGPVVGYCKHDIEPSGSIKDMVFFHMMAGE